MDEIKLEELIIKNIDFVKGQSLIKFLKENELMSDLLKIIDKVAEEEVQFLIDSAYDD